MLRKLWGMLLFLTSGILILLGGYLFIFGCQVANISAPVRSTRLPTFTPTIVPSATLITTLTPIPSATLIPSPTVTFPAPQPFHGTLPAGIEMRFGQGGFGNMALSPDGNYLAVTSGIGVILYQPETLTELKVLPEIRFFTWAPDSNRAIVTTPKGVFVWNVTRNNPVQNLSIENVTDCVWSPNGDKLALVNDKEIEIWELKLSKLVYSFSGHSPYLNDWNRISDILWVNEEKIISVDDGDHILLWEAETGKIIHTWDDTDNGSLRHIALSPDKTTLAITGLNKGELSLWDLNSSQELKIIGNFPEFLRDVTWSPDGKTIALLTQFPSTIVFIDTESGAIQREFSTNVYNIHSLAWLKDGKEVITMNDGDGDVITVWNIQSGQGVHGIRGMRANLVEWSPDGKTIAASDGKAITLWDVHSGKPRVLPDEIRNGPLYGGKNYEGIIRMAFSPTGTLLAAESGDDSSRIRVWDTATGMLMESEWYGWHLSQLWWLAETQLIARTYGENELAIWEIGNWEKRRTIDLNSFNADSRNISPNGAFIALAKGNRLEIKKLENSETLYVWDTEMKSGFALIWSPDTTKIAMRNEEKLAVYDTATGEKLNSLELRAGFTDFKWNPDSSAIVYMTWETNTSNNPTNGIGHIYLWPIATSNEKLIFSSRMLFPGRNPAGALSFSPDGKLLALALGQEGLVVIRP